MAPATDNTTDLFVSEHDHQIVQVRPSTLAPTRKAPSMSAHNSGKQLDPRVVRTRERLQAALFELVKERRWDKIRVQDVLDRTGTSRSAFYAHYDNKYDLLTSAIPDMTLPLADPTADVTDFAPLFHHVDDMSGVLQPLLTQPVFFEITGSFHRAAVAAWLRFFDEGNHPYGKLEAEFLAGALVAVIKTYGMEEWRPSPADAAARFGELVARVLQLEE